MSIRQKVACTRLSALGLKQGQVHSILNQINFWKSCNGQQWTVNRLKDLKQLFIRRLAGLDYQPSVWIAVHSDGTPKGPFRPLFREGQTSKQLGRSLNALMAYTEEIHSDVPTEMQWQKFRTSVEEPMPSRLKYTGTPGGKPILKPGPPVSMEMYPYSPNKRAPAYKGSVPETSFAAQWEGFWNIGVNRQVTQAFPELYEPVFGQYWNKRPRELPKSFWDNWQLEGVGNISFLQEPGLKLRAIANPYRFHQMALEPLKVAVMDGLKSISKDCVHDQNAGVMKAQEWLRQGFEVHTLDLSDATNNAPLDNTLEYLRYVSDPTLHPYISLFEVLSRSPWRVKDPTTGVVRQMRWKKGQPLGLGPSFGAFSLWHHMVARTACSKGKGDYRIIGDDIVMVGDEAVLKYRELLEASGVPVSEGKCLSSRKICEFAGKVILPDRILPVAKWRELSDRNFMEYVKFFGPQFIGALRPRQKVLAKVLLELPEEYGGLGFNPKGKSWSARVDAFWPWVEYTLDERDEPEYVAASNTTLPSAEMLKAGLLSLPEPNPQSWAASERTGVHYAGKPRQEHLTKVLGGHLPPGEVHSRIVEMTSITSGVFHDIPSHLTPTSRTDGDPRGRTTLDILEQKLEKTVGPQGLPDLDAELQKASDTDKKRRNAQSREPEQEL